MTNGTSHETLQLSVVLVARNEGRHLIRTIRSLTETLPPSAEIILIDDGSDRDTTHRALDFPNVARYVRPHSQGVTKARNYGATLARGDIIVFADAHIDFPEDWWVPLVDALADSRVGAASPAVSAMRDGQVKGYGLCLTGADLSTRWLPRQASVAYPVPILPGCCLAMRRETFLATGGFDDGMSTWGMSDIELSIRLWLLGYRLVVIPQVEVAHLFRERHPYPVQWSSVLHNILRTAFVHFREDRVARVIDAVKSRASFSKALAMLCASRAAERRLAQASQRVHDDQWFFRRFPQTV
jgi:glycosyltransferase involved in cell wall biosynthesis